VKEVARSIRWIPMEKRALSLKFMDKPVTKMSERLTLNYPREMQVFIDQPQELVIMLPAASRGDPEFYLSFAIRQVDEKQPWPEIIDFLGQRLSNETHLTSKLEWETRFGDPPRVISKPAIGQGRTSERNLSFALVRLEPKRVAVVTAVMGPSDTPPTATIINLFGKIVDSIRSSGSAESSKEAFHL
jgi:hypothetical protein